MAMGASAYSQWMKVQPQVYRCHIQDWQTWEQILSPLQDEQLRQNPDVLIYTFEDNLNVPQPHAMKALYTLMKLPKHPRKVIILVNAPRMLRIFMRIAQQVYGVWQREDEYIFKATLSEALASLDERPYKNPPPHKPNPFLS